MTFPFNFFVAAFAGAFFAAAFLAGAAFLAPGVAFWSGRPSVKPAVSAARSFFAFDFSRK